MIVFIIVPPSPGTLLYRQRALHDFFNIPRIVFLLPEADEAQWSHVRPNAEIVTYTTYDLRQIRDTILHEFAEEETHTICHYDVELTRRLPRIQRLSKCTKNDIHILLGYLQMQVSSSNVFHGSISQRAQNHKKPGIRSLIGRPTFLNFYSPSKVLEIGYDFLQAPETLIDEDLTLTLLRAGYANSINHEFASRVVGKQPEVTQADAFTLEGLHPGLVEAVDRGNKWSVICQWRQAYEIGV